MDVNSISDFYPKIRWPKEEMETTDIKTKKRLTMHWGFHPKCSILEHYNKRKEGDKGLVSLRVIIRSETTNTSGKWAILMMMVMVRLWDTDYFREQKSEKEEKQEQTLSSAGSLRKTILHGGRS